MKHAVLSLALTACLAACAPETPTPAEPAEERFEDHLSGASFVTSDLEASINFYTNFVGLVQRGKVRQLSGQETLDVYGAAEGTVINYVSLVPIGWPETYPGHPGINLAQIETYQALLPKEGQRLPYTGETVLAFSVRNIEDKAAAMEAAGVSILVPLAPSETGRSMAITVLDPSGMRVQLYQFN